MIWQFQSSLVVKNSWIESKSSQNPTENSLDCQNIGKITLEHWQMTWSKLADKIRPKKVSKSSWEKITEQYKVWTAEAVKSYKTN